MSARGEVSRANKQRQHTGDCGRDRHYRAYAPSLPPGDNPGKRRCKREGGNYLKRKAPPSRGADRRGPPGQERQDKHDDPKPRERKRQERAGHTLSSIRKGENRPKAASKGSLRHVKRQAQTPETPGRAHPLYRPKLSRHTCTQHEAAHGQKKGQYTNCGPNRRRCVCFSLFFGDNQQCRS